MIGAMRKNRKVLAIVLWLVIIAFISTIFVVWGIGSKEQVASYAVKIDGDTVSYDEYRNIYDQQLASIRQTLGDDFANKQNDSAEFSQLVLNDIIDTRLLLKEANKIGIPATNYEIIAEIRKVSAFKTGGEFDPEAYRNVLAMNRQTPTSFEQILKDSIKVEKFKNLITNSQYVVSKDEVKNEYIFRNTKAEVEYFSVPTKNFVDQITVTADNLSAFYEETKEEYKIPTKIKLQYLAFDRSTFKDNSTVLDEEVAQYYDKNLSSFTRAETMDIRTIGVSVANPSDVEEQTKAKTKIDSALVELQKGAKFVDMVEKYSDSSLKVNGGLISGILAEEMQKEMADAVKILKDGEYSNVVKIDGGYLLMYLEKRVPAKVSTLAEVKDEIAAKLKESKVASSYRKYIYDLYKAILNAGNITAYMKAKPENGLQVLQTPMFTEKDNVVSVFQNQPDTKAKIFALNKTDMSQVVADGNMTYFFEVTEKEDSFIPLLDNVMERVTAAYKAREAAKLAEENVTKAIQADGFEKVAQQFNVPIITTKPMIRTETGIFSPSQKFIDAIFKAESGEMLDKAYLVGANVYAAKIKAIIPPSDDNLAAEKDVIESYIRTVKAEVALEAYIEALKQQTKIEISPSFVQNILDQKKTK